MRPCQIAHAARDDSPRPFSSAAYVAFFSFFFLHFHSFVDANPELFSSTVSAGPAFSLVAVGCAIPSSSFAESYANISLFIYLFLFFETAQVDPARDPATFTALDVRIYSYRRRCPHRLMYSKASSRPPPPAGPLLIAPCLLCYPAADDSSQMTRRAMSKYDSSEKMVTCRSSYTIRSLQ